MKLVFATIALSTVIAGCSSLGLATPKGFDQSLAEAYGVHTAVVSATATALSSGALNSAEAEAVKKQADSARQLLDAAKAAEGVSNMASAQNDLTLALGALTALQTYLNGVK